MLGDLKRGQVAVSLQPKLERRIALEEHTTKLLRLELTTERKISTEWMRAARAQTERLESRHAWYKSPVFWFAVGFLAATGLSYGVAKLYAETH